MLRTLRSTSIAGGEAPGMAVVIDSLPSPAPMLDNGVRHFDAEDLEPFGACRGDLGMA